MIYDIGIIGGGASGLTAALTAARQDASVFILEKEKAAGKKLLATGNGRCNFSNLTIRRENIGEMVRETGAYRTGSSETAMITVLSAFDSSDAAAMMEALGLSFHARGDYLYPRSDQAAAVADALRWAVAEHKKVDVFCHETAEKVSREKGLFQVTAAGGRRFSCRQLILACGSPAGLKKEKMTNGMDLAGMLGLKTRPLYPALCPLKCSEAFLSRLAGVRTAAAVSLCIDDHFAAADRGEVQLTAYGLSGIPVFQVSRYASLALAEGRPVTAHLDLVPEMGQKDLKAHLAEVIRRHPGHSMPMILGGILNRKLADVITDLAAISKEQKAGSLDPEGLGRVVKIMKKMRFHVTGTGDLTQAQVCTGGVLLDEIDPQDMSVRRIPGLYVTGEMLDVDGICGGFNLQWAWATGSLAGRAAGRRSHDQS